MQVTFFEERGFIASLPSQTTNTRFTHCNDTTTA